MARFSGFGHDGQLSSAQPPHAPRLGDTTCIDSPCFLREPARFAESDGPTIVRPAIYPIKRLGHTSFEDLLRFSDLDGGGLVKRRYHGDVLQQRLGAAKLLYRQTVRAPSLVQVTSTPGIPCRQPVYCELSPCRVGARS